MGNNRHCAVFLLSGFLGSGKTTLLRHLLENRPDGETLVVMMNEFGRIGVDGEIIRRAGLEIVEINRGSIFCACAKGDFMRGLHAIARDYEPTILLIEASGIADTRDMKRDLAVGPLGRFYELRGNLCVIDADRFRDWADHFNAVPRQVESATALIVNKRDLVDDRTAEAVKAQLRELNAEAPIYETSFGRIDWDLLRPDAARLVTAGDWDLPSAEEWEAYIEAALADPQSHLAPPDELLSQCVTWTGEPSAFREALEGLPEDVVRAKGYFRDEEGRWTLFDLVEGRPVTFGPLERDADVPDENLAVFIRREKETQTIPRLLFRAGLLLQAIKN